jgi:hypothetical protein
MRSGRSPARHGGHSVGGMGQRSGETQTNLALEEGQNGLHASRKDAGARDRLLGQDSNLQPTG